MRLKLRRSRAATWRRRVGARGVIISLLPLNLPDHAAATILEQAKWVARRMKRTDFATIAECPAALARAINEVDGLFCKLATPNLGGNGNAIVVNTRKIDNVKFSDYPISFKANSGDSYTLHMARVTATKGGVKITVDGIHAPSRGRYKTSAPDGAREHVFNVIGDKTPENTDVHLVAGDTNWTVRQVTHALQVSNRRWRHVGGSGVEQVYAIGVTDLGQRTLKYGRASDHQTTARVKIGAAA